MELDTSQDFALIFRRCRGLVAYRQGTNAYNLKGEPIRFEELEARFEVAELRPQLGNARAGGDRERVNKIQSRIAELQAVLRSAPL